MTEGARATSCFHLLYRNALSLTRLRRELPPRGSLSFMYSMGLVAIIFIIFSLVFPESIRIKHLYHMVCILIPVNLFSFFTFELKLFSKHIWIRRMVVIAFSLLVLFVGLYIFGSTRFELKSLVVYCIAALIFTMVIVFAYYVADKIEQRNLNLINQKLSEKNKGNIE